MTPRSIAQKIEEMSRTAETGEAFAEICRLEAIRLEAIKIARRHCASEDQITEINLVHDDRCEIASVGLGRDSDGTARFALNFAL